MPLHGRATSRVENEARRNELLGAKGSFNTGHWLGRGGAHCEMGDGFIPDGAHPLMILLN
jgi:hypothetical protein